MSKPTGKSEVDPSNVEPAETKTEKAEAGAISENPAQVKPSDKPPRPAARDSESFSPLPDLRAPERKLVLSDLFDSAPPPSGRISLSPPNPTDYWSSRPPPAAEKALPAVAVKPPAVEAKPIETAPEPDSAAPAADEVHPALAALDEELEIRASVEETIPLDLQRDPSGEKTESAPKLSSRDETTQGMLAPELDVDVDVDVSPETPAPLQSRPVLELTPDESPIPESLTPDPPSAPAAGPPEPSITEVSPAAPAPPAAVTSAALPSVMVADTSPSQPPPPSPEELQHRAARAAKATMIIELPEGLSQPDFTGDDLQAAIQAARTSSVPPAPQGSPAIATPTSPERPKTNMWVAAGVMFALAAILIGYRVFVPSTGILVVTAQGPGGAPIDSVSISIQGLTCGTSPCIISGLKSGTQSVTVTGKGLEPSTSSVEIQAGEELAYNVLLSSKASGSTVQQGADAAGKEATSDAEPVSYGIVTIELNSSSKGASVTLDDAFLLDFPAEMELEAGVEHQLSASKRGYRDFHTTIEVTAGQSPQVIEVDLRRGTARKKKSSRTASRRRKSSRKKKKSKKPTGDPSQGRLTLRSTPPSNVILNGRPIGKTPKTAIRVPGDTLQTIVFVHPEKGRRRAQKYVKAGESQTVSIQF